MDRRRVASLEEVVLEAGRHLEASHREVLPRVARHLDRQAEDLAEPALEMRTSEIRGPRMPVRDGTWRQHRRGIMPGQSCGISSKQPSSHYDM